MLQLNPLEEFVIARGLEDHSDSTTYYVRAVIRNAKTDALIATLDLVDQGDHHRYTKTWQVVSDPTGEGLWITICTSVYTDSGYTTKADNYGEKTETYLVEQRPRWHGGGGGSDVSYKKIREIVQEEIGKIPPTEPTKKEPIDFSPLSDALQAILSEVRGIEIPEAEKVDLKPVLADLDALKDLAQRILDKEQPELELSPVLDAIGELRSSVEAISPDELLRHSNETLTRIREFFGNDVEEIKQNTNRLATAIEAIGYIIPTLPKKSINDQPE